MVDANNALLAVRAGDGGTSSKKKTMKPRSSRKQLRHYPHGRLTQSNLETRRRRKLPSRQLDPKQQQLARLRVHIVRNGCLTGTKRVVPRCLSKYGFRRCVTGTQLNMASRSWMAGHFNANIVPHRSSRVPANGSTSQDVSGDATKKACLSTLVW